MDETEGSLVEDMMVKETSDFDEKQVCEKRMKVKAMIEASRECKAMQGSERAVRLVGQGP
jgi:hypothetical protein